MGHVRRIAYTVAAEIALAILAIIYLYAGVPLIDLAVNTHTGPFSGAVEILYTIIPAIIGILQLAIVVWLVVSPVQRQRSVSRVPRR